MNTSMRYPFVSPLIFSLWLCMSGLSISQTQAQNSLPPEKIKLLETSLHSGDQKWKAKEYYEAGQFYAKAIEIAPEQTNARYRLAECHRLTFDSQAAETTYAQVFQADAKTYPLAQYYHALMLKTNGKYAEAILHLDEFVTAWPNPGDRPEAISEDILSRAKQLKDRCQVAMNEPQPDLSYFDNNKLSDLSAEYRIKADKIVQRKEAGRMHMEEMPLFGEEAYFYNLQLSKEESARVTKITANGLEKLSNAQMEVIRAGDQQYYQRLTADGKARIDRFAVAYRRATDANERVIVSEEDDMFYSLLNREQKNQLDRTIAYRMHVAVSSQMARLKNKRSHLDEIQQSTPTAMIASLEPKPVVEPVLSEAEQRTADLRYYNELPEKDKSILDRIIEAKRLSKRTGDPLLLSGEDKFYYEKLSEQDQARIDRLMNQLPEKATLTAAEQKAEDLRYYHSLPEKEKALLDAIIADKRLAKRTGNELVLDGEEKFYYEKLSEAEKARVGRLTTWFEENEKSRTAFQSDLPVEKAQSEDMAAGFSNPEPIFFNFDEDQLRPEAVKALDDLAGFCQKFPAAKIEIHAFADDKGEAKYNRDLSKKRGQSAVNYLAKLGISVKHIKVKPHGEGDLQSLGDSLFARQVNRRVEFVVKGGPATYVWENQTYILQPSATLYSIARAFGLTVEELKALNGLTSEHIEAYRPIRARNMNGVIPTPMVNDPYFWIRKKAERSLTIK